MAHKYFSLVLHSHIPFVLSHGTWPHGTDWLYEAAAESYLPLLDVFFRLREEGLSPQVNISFTPVLLEQLKDKNFAAGFSDYLKMKVESAQKDGRYFEKAGNKTLASLAVFWEDWYEKIRERFLRNYRQDIVGAFRILQDEGLVEVLTSAATHSYFPLLSKDKSIDWQVRQGRQTYRNHFGREPRGFWLPECGYRPGYAWKSPLGGKDPQLRPGVDEILAEAGIGYFFVDAHLLRGGEAKGVYLDRFPALRHLWEKFKKEYRPSEATSKDPYSPYLAYPSRVPFLTRDETSGSQVWSSKNGYPGDPWYLEFHKKHFPGGLRYWRVTSGEADLGDKLEYNPAKAATRLEEHSSHFVDLLRRTLKDRDGGAVVALYDTELFGHWWFEGPEWLYLVLKKLHQSEVRPLTSTGCLERLPAHTLISLPEGSWGQGGFHWIWLNEDTEWIWKKIYRIEQEVCRLNVSDSALSQRLLKQLMREKFLLESSDWPFLISTWTARDYGEIRAALHYERAQTILDWLSRGMELSPEEKKSLETWEVEDCLFEKVITPDGRFI